MDEGVINRVMQLYGIPYEAVLPAQKGYRNSSYPIVTKNGTLNLILYKSEPDILPRIKRTNNIGNFLAEQGLPTRQTYDPRILALKNSSQTRYASLYRYLPGDTIAWEAYSMEHLKALGGMLGRIHHALASYSEELPDVVSESRALQKRLHSYFAQPGVQRALAAKLSLQIQNFDFSKVFNTLDAIPKQALHMDFVRGNILFTDKTISGVLDFEKAASGNVAFDVARTLAFLLVDCKYKDEIKIRKYFLDSGYQKRGGGTVPKEVNQLVYFYLLHDFYKFLRHNPYEFLPQNEHFVRTKEQLLKVGLIRQV